MQISVSTFQQQNLQIFVVQFGLKFVSRLCLYFAEVKKRRDYRVSVNTWLKLYFNFLLFNNILNLGLHFFCLQRCCGFYFFKEIVNGLLP